MKERWIERGEMKPPAVEKFVPMNQLYEQAPLQTVPVAAVLPLPVRSVAS